MRKSSRGNPYHDERGRFCSADKCNKKSEGTAEEYEEQTKKRMIKHMGLEPDEKGVARSAYKSQKGNPQDINTNKIVEKHGMLGFEAKDVVTGETEWNAADTEQLKAWADKVVEEAIEKMTSHPEEIGKANERIKERFAEWDVDTATTIWEQLETGDADLEGNTIIVSDSLDNEITVCVVGNKLCSDDMKVVYAEADNRDGFIKNAVDFIDGYRYS